MWLDQYQEANARRKSVRLVKKRRRSDESLSASMEDLSQVSGFDEILGEIFRAMAGGLRGPVAIGLGNCLIYDQVVLIPLSGNYVNVVLKNGNRSRTFTVQKTLMFAGRQEALARLRQELVS